MKLRPVLQITGKPNLRGIFAPQNYHSILRSIWRGDGGNFKEISPNEINGLRFFKVLAILPLTIN